MASKVMIRDPFHGGRGLMRRTFDEGFPSWFEDVAGSNGRGARSPSLPLDVFETEDGLRVEAPLPGFSKDEVEVTLEQGKLTLRAEKSDAHEESTDEDGRTYFLRERSHGTVSRSILIGDSYDPDSVEGSLKDGVLTLSVQKAAAAQPRRVAITAS
jgi:HSP20 family protein